MLSVVQTGNGTPHGKYKYTRHCSCAHKQKRRHFHAKTTSAKLYIYNGVGTCTLTKPTRRWSNSALRHF